jgi:CheY-like chemotaxis protein
MSDEPSKAEVGGKSAEPHGDNMAKVLIVEDEIDLVEAYTDVLEAAGHHVRAVPRAADAIRLVSHYRPDVMILDLNLPGDSGLIVINFVRVYKPIADVKIIIASGHAELIEQTGHLASRVNLILRKPVSNQLLLDSVDKLAPSVS